MNVAIEYINQIFDHCLELPEDQLKYQSIAPDMSHWSQYVGHYLDIYENGLVELTEKAHRPILKRGNREEVMLEAIAHDMYVERGSDGAIRTTIGLVPHDTLHGQKFIVINESPCAEFSWDATLVPVGEVLQKYVGVYADKVHYIRIRYEQGALFAYIKNWDKEFRCTPIDERRIHAGGIGLLTFIQEGERISMDVAGLFSLERQRCGE